MEISSVEMDARQHVVLRLAINAQEAWYQHLMLAKKPAEMEKIWVAINVTMEITLIMTDVLPIPTNFCT